MKKYKTPMFKPHELRMGRLMDVSRQKDVKFTSDPNSDEPGNAAFETEDAFL